MPTDARHFVALAFAMRAVAESSDKADPPLSATWNQFRRDVGLSSGAPDWEEKSWHNHLEAVRNHCRECGKTPRQVLKSWQSGERAARDYIATLDDHNRRRVRAASVIHNAAMDDDGVRIHGRNRTSGMFEEISTSTLIDPRTRFQRDPAASLYEDRVRYFNQLDAPGGGYDQLSLSTRAIRGLAVAPVRRTRSRPAVDIAKAAALAIFPHGPPSGTLVKNQIADIEAEVLLRKGRAAERSIRTAIKELWAEGKWQ